MLLHLLAVLTAVGPFSTKKAADQGELTLLFDTADVVLESLTELQPVHSRKAQIYSAAAAAAKEKDVMADSDEQEQSEADHDAAAHLEALRACLSWVLKALGKARMMQHSDSEVDSSSLESTVHKFIAERFMMFAELCSSSLFEEASQVCPLTPGQV